MKILAVDDNPENLSLLEVLLQGYGYEVTSARNGAEALEKALQDRFDLIISDILMPQMDGFQLCHAVKSNAQLHDVAFVFYSATYTDARDQELALRLGADKFVAKPEDPRVLLAVVQDVIRQRTASTPVTPPPPEMEEAVYMKQYNERLIYKLEEKMLQLEEAHRKLAASEAQYRALVEQANDAVIMLAPGGQVRFVNPKFCAWFGYGQEEATRLHIRDLVHPDEADWVTTSFQDLMTGARPPILGELRCLTKSGALVYADLNANSVVYEGSLIGAQAILRDIAERKRAEEVLQQKDEEIRLISQQLWQAAKLATMGELAASIAHELNNPLATVSLRVELLLAQISAPDPKRRALEVIEQEVERMGNLVTHLLQFSRRGHPQISSLDVREEIDNTVAFMHYHLRNYRITAVREYAPDVPLILADRQQLRQVFLNLLTNASDAMPQGGTLTLRVTRGALDSGAPAVVIEFADTGIGIAPEHLSQVMEPFFTTKEAGKGTGLGLAICRRAVQEHRGVFSLASVVGQGTTVRIALPITTPQSTHIE